MSNVMGNRRIADELQKRGLVPPNCKLLEMRIEPAGALVIHYEVFVTGDRVLQFADALRAAAQAQVDDDERNRQARAETP